MSRAVAATVGVVLIAAGCSGAPSSSPSTTPQAVALPSPPVATPLGPAAEPPIEDGREPCPSISAGNAAIVTFRSKRGRCVPATKLVSYRCAAELDPVIERRAGPDGTTRFIGGRFAAPIRELPEEAFLAGRVGRTKVFALRGLRRWLYVSEEGTLTRWLVLPEARRVSQPPAAFMVGDSILSGAQVYVSDVLPGWTLTMDPEIGRASFAGASIAAARAPLLRGVAVVELGTNDSDPLAFRENAGVILTSFERMQMVLWVSVHSPDEVAREVNGEIRRAVAAAPNTVLGDWNHSVTDEAFLPDGVHLLPESQGVFARFLAPYLRTWHAAATNSGATECSGEAAAALD